MAFQLHLDKNTPPGRCGAFPLIGLGYTIKLVPNNGNIYEIM